MYRAAIPPELFPAGRPSKLTTAAKQALLEYQRRVPSAYQDELLEFMQQELDISVHKSTICQFLKTEGISHKKGQRMGPQNEPLRRAWQAEMPSFTAEQLVFIDESLFKIQSCWRNMAYWPIGEPARWSDNID